MNILEEIKEERARQDDRWGEQNHPITTLNPDYARVVSNELRVMCDQDFANGSGDWLGILNEEVYEAVAEAAEGNMDKCRVELIQVAAVVVAMIECIDRNNT